jgi:hypothetical protein
MRCTHSLFVASALCFAVCGPVFAQSDTRPRLHTNQTEVEEATRATELAISDPLAVFAFVLGSLPARVKVYPTENYYYFSFLHKGVRYGGNIRLDRSDRDDGKVNFAYFPDRGELQDDGGETFFRLLSSADGVKVEKLERFLYRVSYGERSVLFELNDLSAVKPPAGALGPDDKFLGPVFDESAIRFFLVFNTRLKVFHYILDETVPVADEFVTAKRSDRVLIGRRTAFAFYRDHKLERKILIGVYEGNGRANNYFDGPFDQLPDNFIEGDDLRDAILAVEPELKGKIDRFGGSPGGAERYLIGPYAYYRTEDDLQPFHACATSKRVRPELYYACFLNIEGRDRSSRARPAAMLPAPRAPKSKR